MRVGKRKGENGREVVLLELVDCFYVCGLDGGAIAG